MATRQHFIWGFGRLRSNQNNKQQQEQYYDNTSSISHTTPTPKLLQALETTTSLRSIYAGQHSIIAVTNSGELYSWGNISSTTLTSDNNARTNRHAEAASEESYTTSSRNKLDVVSRFLPVLDMQDKGVYHISMQNSAVYAITASNEVYGWKLFDNELTDHSPTSIQSLVSSPPCVAQLIPALSLSYLSAASIACGSNMMLILTSAGTLFSFGKNSHGRLGLGHTHDVSEPSLVDTGNRLLTRISAGYNHAAAISHTGVCLTWGCGLHGRLGNGRNECDDETSPTPVHASLDCPVLDVACGYHHTLVLDVQGRVWSFGGNQHGQGGWGFNGDDDLNDPAPTFVTHPACLSISEQVVSINAGAFHSACITSLSELLVWGWNRFGQLGLGAKTDAQYYPTVVTALSGMDVVLVSCASDYTVAVTDHFMSVEPNYFEGSNHDDIKNSSTLYSRGSMDNSICSNAAVVFEESSTESNTRNPSREKLSRKGSSVLDRERSQSAADSMQRSTLLALVKEALLIPPVTSVSDLDSECSVAPSPPSLYREGSVPNGHDSQPRFASRRSTSESLVDSVAISKMNDAYFQKLQRNARVAALQRVQEQKRVAEEEKRALAASRALVKREKLMDEAAEEWLKSILPNWHDPKIKQRARDVVSKYGIPAKIRGTVWPVLIGNSLMINPELFRIFGERAARFKSMNNPESSANHLHSDLDSPAFGKEHTFSYIDVDVSRTFPQLAFFQRECAIHEDLRHVLYTYCFYRPDVGYIQGISYISAILLLYMPCFQAFSCFANLLNSPFFHAFLKFQTSAIDGRYSVFYDLLKENSSQLHQHLVNDQSISADMFYLEWCMTLFSKRLKLEVVSRVWDLVIVFGEIAVHKTSVAILLCLKAQLLKSQDMASTLKILSGAPMQITEEALMSEFARVQVSEKIQNRVRRLQTMEGT